MHHRSPHYHTYEEGVWEYDGDYHWNPATCVHTDPSVEPHGTQTSHYYENSVCRDCGLYNALIECKNDDLAECDHFYAFGTTYTKDGTICCEGYLFENGNDIKKKLLSKYNKTLSLSVSAFAKGAPTEGEWYVLDSESGKYIPCLSCHKHNFSNGDCSCGFPAPPELNCTSAEYKDLIHFYALGETFTYMDEYEMVKGYLMQGSMVLVCDEMNPVEYGLVDFFDGEVTKGWYYMDESQFESTGPAFFRCDAHIPHEHDYTDHYETVTVDDKVYVYNVCSCGEKGPNPTVKTNGVNTDLTINTEVESNVTGSAVSGVAISNADDVMKNLLAKADLSSAANGAVEGALNTAGAAGAVDVTLKLEVKDAVITDVAKAQMLAKAPADADLENAMLFDAEISLLINGSVAGKITETGSNVNVSITLPDDMVKDGYSYYIIREHDGEYTLLPATRNGNLLTFSSDKFSTFAVVYKKAAPASGSADSSTPHRVSPQTGDDSSMALYVVVMMLSMMVLAGCMVYNRKRS